MKNKFYLSIVNNFIDNLCVGNNIFIYNLKFLRYENWIKNK